MVYPLQDDYSVISESRLRYSNVCLRKIKKSKENGLQTIGISLQRIWIHISIK